MAIRQGRRNAACILDENAVRQLRQLDLAPGPGVNVREAAIAYGVGQETIRRVLRGDTWRHVTAVPPPTEEHFRAGAAKLAEMFRAQGLVEQTVVDVHEELGIPVSDEVKRKAAFLTGRSPDGGDAGN
jgi:hypothetical protein